MGVRGAEDVTGNAGIDRRIDSSQMPEFRGLAGRFR